MSNEFCPRLTAYIPHTPTPIQRVFLVMPQKEVFFGGAAGGGKGLPEEAGVLTPWGYRCIKDLDIGSVVSATDGTVTKVIGKWVRGKQPCYRLTWHDGTETICDSDHIWLGWITGKSRKIKNSRSHGEQSARKWTTRELHNWFISARTNRRQRFAIPVISEPVAYNVHGQNKGRYLHISRTIPPYVLGVMLGDGWSRGSTAFCSADEEIVHNVSRELGRELKPWPSTLSLTAKSYPVPEIRGDMKALGLQGRRSWEKHIPRIYKLATVEERWALLQGLMDTDGWCEADGDCYFTSTSERLRDDVSEVARSLGAVTFHRQSRKSYTKNKERVLCRMAYTVRIKIPRADRLFRLTRKQAMVGNDPQSMSKYLKSIEPVSARKTICIQVAHPNSLFITDGFVVTHNTDALLMAALQYVDIPGYNALIVRKTLADAKKPSSILFRARQWLDSTPAIWRGSEHCWYFPSGATLKFGKLANIGDAASYQGDEYSFIGFDELTHFYESDFDFVCTRLRRPKCPEHPSEPNPKCPACFEYSQVARVPLRIRTASNPGGLGHIWVKKRYAIKAIPGKQNRRGKPLYCGTRSDRPHVPAFIWDNKYLDAEEYEQQLRDVGDPVTREQLLSGDWGITAEGRFKQQWMNYFTLHGGWVELGGNKQRHEATETFIVIDPAASTRSTPGRNELTKKMASYTAMGVFTVTPDNKLMIRHMTRFQDEVPEIRRRLRSLVDRWNPDFVGMEHSAMAVHLYQILTQEGFRMKKFSPYTHDKVSRSVPAANMMEAGDIWLPEQPSHWKEEFEAELYTWTGDPIETDDQIDVLSYAAQYVNKRQRMGVTDPRDLPAVI